MARKLDPTWAAFLGIVVIAGLNFVAVRFSNRELAPFWGAALRFGAASALFLAAALVLRRPFPRGRAFLGAGTYGVLAFGASYALAYRGLVAAPAALAAVLIALVPLATLLLAPLHGLERMTGRASAGALVSAAGVAIVFWDQLGASVPAVSIVALLGAALCIAESALVVKKVPRVDPLAMNGIAMAIGTALLLSLSWLVEEPWRLPRAAPTRAALAYLIVIGSVGLFLLYLFVLSRWSASAASYQTVLSPLVTVSAGAALAGERIGWAFAVGGALVLAGVYAGALAHTARPTQFK